MELYIIYVLGNTVYRVRDANSSRIKSITLKKGENEIYHGVYYLWIKYESGCNNIKDNN